MGPRKKNDCSKGSQESGNSPSIGNERFKGCIPTPISTLKKNKGLGGRNGKSILLIKKRGKFEIRSAIGSSTS